MHSQILWPLEAMFFETLVVPWGVTRKSRVSQLSSSGLTCKSCVWLLLVRDVVVKCCDGWITSSFPGCILARNFGVTGCILARNFRVT